MLGVSDCGGTPRPLERGDSFGEIALLPECTPTATATARETLLFVLEREVLLNAVSTHPRSSAVAEQTATTRLARDVAARTGSPV